MPFSMPYRSALEEALRRAVRNCDLECVLADNSHLGQVSETIRREIREAAVCIADVTEKNANVAYEVGLAVALGKTLILISQDPEKTIFDLRHHHRIPDSASGEGLAALGQALEGLLRRSARRELLRLMLVPPDLPHKDGPFIIAANPLSWREGKRWEGGFPRLTGTQVEYVGVRSLLLEFGALRAADSEPELLNPSDSRDNVAQEAMHLSSLGSPKANRWTGLILAEFNRRWVPSFQFKADPDSDLRDLSVRLWKEGQPYGPLGRSYWQDRCCPCPRTPALTST
jgi:hypothetical protein